MNLDPAYVARKAIVGGLIGALGAVITPLLLGLAAPLVTVGLVGGLVGLITGALDALFGE